MDGIPAVGLHAFPWLLRNQRWRHDPTRDPSVGQRAIQAIPARAGLVRDDESRGATVQPPQQFVDVRFPGTDLADIDHVRRAVRAGMGDGDGCVVDVQAHEKGGRLRHG